MSEKPNVLTSEELREMQAELNKEHGFLFGSDEKLRLNVLPLEIPSLDHALDGGFAFGRITMLIGEWGSGKTLLALLAIKAAQERGISCAYIDAERTWNPEWATALGVDVDDILVDQPVDGQKAFDAAVDLCQRRVGVLVIDSLAELTPKDELEADSVGDALMGVQARMINRGLRVLKANNEQTLIILINQLRQKIGVMFGNPETLPGGLGQRYAAWQIVRVMRGDWITDTEDKRKRTGYDLKIRVEKSKQGAPFKEASIPFLFTGELDFVGSLVAVCLDMGIITKNGSKFSVPGMEGTIFGMPRLIRTVKEDALLLDKLQAAIDNVEEI